MAGGVIFGAIAASVFWEFRYQPRTEPSRSTVLDALEPSFSHLPEVAKQAVGVFGALDATMPALAYFGWFLLIAALTAAAMVAGSNRDRLATIGLIAAAVAVTMVMSVVYSEIGRLHGRYALPFLVLLPLWLGEVLLRRRERLPDAAMTALTAGVFLVAASVHLVGWWTSARRFAVSDNGSWLFLGEEAWSPPLGWIPWLLAALAAAAAYAAAAFAVATRRAS